MRRLQLLSGWGPLGEDDRRGGAQGDRVPHRGLPRSVLTEDAGIRWPDGRAGPTTPSSPPGLGRAGTDERTLVELTDVPFDHPSARCAEYGWSS